MRALILGALIAASALPAVAQTTTCGAEMGKWVCRTQPERRGVDLGAYQFPSTADRFQRAYEMGERMREDRERQRPANARSPIAAEVERSEAARAIENYIAAKRCDDAERLATDHFGMEGYRDAAARCRG